MKLRALRLWNVRKFAGRGIAIENIGDGVVDRSRVGCREFGGEMAQPVVKAGLAAIVERGP